MKHKWHKEIKAWADGAEIESRYIVDVEFKELKEWGNDCSPFFDDDDKEFRIKPQPKEPQYLYVYYNSNECEFELETRVLTNPYLRCIGKIKLEE
jgi:hypothetical protein